MTYYLCTGAVLGRGRPAAFISSSDMGESFILVFIDTDVYSQFSMSMAVSKTPELLLCCCQDTTPDYDVKHMDVHD